MFTRKISLAAATVLAMAAACDDGGQDGTEGAGGQTSPDGSVGGAPVGGDPVGGDPVGGDPVGGAPVGGAPVGGDPVGGDPVGGDPVGGTPMGGMPVGGDPVPPPAPLTGDALVGTWSSPGCEAYPDGMGGMNYLDRQFRLTAEAWSLYGTIYGDATCGYPLFSFSVRGNYEITGGSAEHEGTAEATFRIESNDWVAHAPTLAETFTMAGCGREPWVVGAPQSVLETGCIGVAKAEANCANGELDLLRLDGDALYFGERSVDLCTTRAPRPNGFPVVRLPDTLEIDVAGYYPEGIAVQSYLPAYVSSLATGAITRLSADGSADTVVSAFGLGGATVGLKLMGPSLWACVSNPMDPSVAALVHLDFASGAERARYPIPGGGFCNDMVDDAEGNIYVTESFRGGVFVLRVGSEALEPWAEGYAPLPDSAGFSLNGIALAGDRTHLLIGRTDSGDIVRIAIAPDGSAGEVTVEPVDGGPGSIDGLTAWRGHLYVVRNGAVSRLVEGQGAWSTEAIAAAGAVDYPTAVGIDNFGNLWVVEAQFGDLFDADPATNGSTPFRIVRFPTTTP